MLIKGVDYAIDEVVGAEIVQANGGEVKVLSFLDNCSTSAIVEKIQEIIPDREFNRYKSSRAEYSRPGDPVDSPNDDRINAGSYKQQLHAFLY